jgi:hypothetical protein
MLVLSNALDGAHEEYWDWVGSPREAEITATSARRRRSSLRVIGWSAVCAGALFGLVAFAPYRPPSTGVQASKLMEAWVTVSHPLKRFALADPELRAMKSAYEGRRAARGHGTEDVLTFSAPDAGLPFLRLVAAYGSGRIASAPTLFVDAARRAAEAGLAVVRAEQPVLLPTRFGPLEVASVGIGDAQATAACLAFRLLPQRPEISIEGFACGLPNKAPDMASLGCMIDRLDLVDGSGEEELHRFFAEAGRGRVDACPPAARPPTMTRDSEPRQSALSLTTPAKGRGLKGNKLAAELSQRNETLDRVPSGSSG